MKKADVVYESSVNILKNSQVVSKSYYLNKLPKDLRQLAFYISDLEKNRQMTGMVQKALIATQEKGLSFREFADSLDPEIYKKIEKFRLEVVYRNNLNNTYNQSSRYEAVQNIESTPYLLYDATLDGKTRPSHAELDGLILPADDPRWDELVPPLGHNCRCSIVPVSKEDAKLEREAKGKSGLSTSKREYDSIKKKGGGADKDFGGKQSYGNFAGATKSKTQEAIRKMPNGEMKNKFQKSFDEVGSKVDIWYQKNETIFK